MLKPTGYIGHKILFKNDTIFVPNSWIASKYLKISGLVMEFIFDIARGFPKCKQKFTVQSSCAGDKLPRYKFESYRLLVVGFQMLQ